MNNELYSNNDYRYYSLSHFGILGQKWGIRRYQNSDGSLTEEGTKRYSKLAKQKDSLSRKITKSNRRLTKMESKIKKNAYKSQKAAYNAAKYEQKRDKAHDKLKYDASRKYDDKAQRYKKLIGKYNDPKLNLKYEKEKVRNLNLSVKMSKIDSKLERLGAEAVDSILSTNGKTLLLRDLDD